MFKQIIERIKNKIKSPIKNKENKCCGNCNMVKVNYKDRNKLIYCIYDLYPIRPTEKGCIHWVLEDEKTIKLKKERFNGDNNPVLGREYKVINREFEFILTEKDNKPYAIVPIPATKNETLEYEITQCCKSNKENEYVIIGKITNPPLGIGSLYSGFDITGDELNNCKPLKELYENKQKDLDDKWFNRNFK